MYLLVVVCCFRNGGLVVVFGLLSWCVALFLGVAFCCLFFVCLIWLLACWLLYGITVLALLFIVLVCLRVCFCWVLLVGGRFIVFAVDCDVCWRCCCCACVLSAFTFGLGGLIMLNMCFLICLRLIGSYLVFELFTRCLRFGWIVWIYFGRL